MYTASLQRLEHATTIPQRSPAAPANHYGRVRGCPQGSPEEDWFQAERERRYVRPDR